MIGIILMRFLKFILIGISFGNILYATQLITMMKAGYDDKAVVVNILVESFNNNKSVNYIIKQDDKRDWRLKQLMAYSFEMCYHYGHVFLSNDKKGCALVLLPDKKKTIFRSILLDLGLIFSAAGFGNVRKVMRRESKISKLQHKDNVYYLWFIGVDPNEQNNGIGSKLLSELIEEARLQQRTICLETSTLKNIPWYEKFGFSIYNQLDLGYQLFFLKS